MKRHQDVTCATCIPRDMRSRIRLRSSRFMQIKMASENRNHGTNARSTNYRNINDNQKQVLRRFYEEGMTSTGSNMRETIEKAASEAKIDVVRVKVKTTEFNTQ